MNDKDISYATLQYYGSTLLENYLKINIELKTVNKHQELNICPEYKAEISFHCRAQRFIIIIMKLTTEPQQEVTQISIFTTYSYKKHFNNHDLTMLRLSSWYIITLSKQNVYELTVLWRC